MSATARISRPRTASRSYVGRCAPGIARLRLADRLLGGVLVAARGEDAQVDGRLVADRLGVVLDVGRHDEHVARTGLDGLVADGEAHAAADDVDDLLVVVGV